MSTILDPRLDEVTETTNPIVTHILERDDKQSANAKLMEAMVNGTPVTALCGYTWVPSRDPHKYPICQKCLELFEMAKDLRS